MDYSESAFEIKNIYYEICIDKKVEYKNTLIFNAIIESVEENSELCKDIIISNPEISFRLDESKDLVERFIKKIKPVVLKLTDQILKEKGRCITVIAITDCVTKYVIDEMNIGSNEITLLVGFANIITILVIDEMNKSE